MAAANMRVNVGPAGPCGSIDSGAQWKRGMRATPIRRRSGGSGAGGAGGHALARQQCAAEINVRTAGKGSNATQKNWRKMHQPPAIYICLTPKEERDEIITHHIQRSAVKKYRDVR